MAHDGAVGLLLKPKGPLLMPVGGRPLKMTCTLSLPLLLPRYVTLSICKFGLQGVPCGAGVAHPERAAAAGMGDNEHAINTNSHNKFLNNLFMLCLLLLVFDLCWRRSLPVFLYP